MLQLDQLTSRHSDIQTIIKHPNIFACVVTIARTSSQHLQSTTPVNNTLSTIVDVLFALTYFTFDFTAPYQLTGAFLLHNLSFGVMSFLTTLCFTTFVNVSCFGARSPRYAIRPDA